MVCAVSVAASLKKVKGTSGGAVGEPAPMLVPSRLDKVQVSEFKSNGFWGLIWPLRDLTQKGEGTNVGAGVHPDHGVTFAIRHKIVLGT